MMKINNASLNYPARILRFRDGDTAQITMNIGFGVHIERGFRFMDLESWELDGPEKQRALLAAKMLTERFAGVECTAWPATRGFDLYGRIRGSLTIGNDRVEDLIVAAGLAWHISLRNEKRERAC